MIAKKEITKQNVLEAMKLLMANKDKSYPKIANVLEENGFTWSVRDVKYWAEDNNIQGENLGDGLAHGDFAQGATFVANAFSNEIGWSYCQEWLFEDETGAPCIGTWIKQAENSLADGSHMSHAKYDTLDTGVIIKTMKPLDATKMSRESIMRMLRDNSSLMSQGIYNDIMVPDTVIVSQDFADSYLMKSHDGGSCSLQSGDFFTDSYGNKMIIAEVVPNDRFAKMFGNSSDLDMMTSFYSRRGSNSIVKDFDGDFDNDVGPLIVTNISPDAKTHFYDDEQIREGKGRKVSSQLAWSLQSRQAREILSKQKEMGTLLGVSKSGDVDGPSIPYLELKPEKHLAKVAVSHTNGGKYSNPYISSKDGIGYIKYVDTVETGNSDSPSEIIPLIQDGRIFCSVIPANSETGKREVREYAAEEALEIMRSKTHREAARAARLAKFEETFGDFEFDDNEDTNTKSDTDDKELD